MNDEKNQNPKKETPVDKVLGGMYDFPVDEDFELMEQMGEIGPEWRGSMTDYESQLPEMTKQSFQPTPDISTRIERYARAEEKSNTLSDQAFIQSSRVGVEIQEVIASRFYGLCESLLKLNKDEVNERIDKIRFAHSTEEEEQAGVDELYAIWRGMISGISAQLSFSTNKGEWSMLEINQK